MTTSIDQAAPATRPTPPTGPRATLWVLRCTAVPHLLLLALQPLLAGYYLSGDFDAVDAHALNAHLVTGLVLIQLVAAVTYAWPGGGRRWPLAFSTTLFFAEEMQVGMGYATQLGIHLPLGVAIIAAQLLFTVWVLRSGARLPRPRRRTTTREDRS